MTNIMVSKFPVIWIFLIFLVLSLNNSTTFAGQIADAYNQDNMQPMQDLLDQVKDLNELDEQDKRILEELGTFRDNVSARKLHEKYLDLHINYSVNNNFSSGNPLLELGLSKQQTIDLLKACFSNHFTCKLLTRSHADKRDIVVLLGERHDQPREAFVLGEKVLKGFPLVAREGWAEVVPFKGMSQRSFERLGVEPDGGALGYDFSLISNYERSCQKDEPTKVVNLEEGYDLNRIPILQAVRKIKEGSCITAGGVCIGLACSVVQYFTGVDLGGGIKQSIAMAIPMVVGGIAETIRGVRDLFSKDITRVRERDLFMSNRLNLLFSQPDTRRIAVIVGAGHIYGISKLLKEKGFEDHTLDIVTQYASSSTEFERIARDEKNTLNPHQSKMRTEQNYPEDF